MVVVKLVVMMMMTRGMSVRHRRGKGCKQNKTESGCIKCGVRALDKSIFKGKKGAISPLCVGIILLMCQNI